MRVQTQARQTAPGEPQAAVHIRRQFFGEFHFLSPGGRVYPGGHRHGLRYSHLARMGINQFYTITTEDGNVFYLIVDGKRDSNNVYFLNGVTESDLMALAEKSDGSMSVIPAEDVCTCTEKCAAGEVNTSCPVCKNDLKGCIGKEKPEETEKPEEPEPSKKNTGSAGTIIFVIVALLAVGGAGYYVKIVRPKQLAEDDEDFEDGGYGEGFDPDEAFGETEYLSEDDFDDRMDDNEPRTANNAVLLYATTMKKVRIISWERQISTTAAASCGCWRRFSARYASLAWFPHRHLPFRRGRKQAPGWVTTMWGLTDSIITRRRLTLTWSIIPMGQWT